MTADLAARVAAGDRRALARAITLVESSRAADRAAAEDLITALLPRTGGTLRVGISGPPGVGKSTLIERLGLDLAEAGRRLAVLAVDPSSRLSGGSILGDKTRMSELARHPNAYIRPTPAGDQLGGVARHTREAILLCEAAGFELVLVETVGVGQSETAVADMTDLLVLLAQPGGGDDLQGIKRGIVELADLVLVTKADGELAAAAGRAAADYQSALHLLHGPQAAPVLQVSGLTGAGIAEAWAALERLGAEATASGRLPRRRAAQAIAWLRSELVQQVTEWLAEDAVLAEGLTAAERAVAEGKALPSAAARALLREALRSGQPGCPPPAAP
jgi:LAO/AO transport system kinase